MRGHFFILSVLQDTLFETEFYTFLSYPLRFGGLWHTGPCWDLCTPRQSLFFLVIWKHLSLPREKTSAPCTIYCTALWETERAASLTKDNSSLSSRLCPENDLPSSFLYWENWFGEGPHSFVSKPRFFLFFFFKYRKSISLKKWLRKKAGLLACRFFPSTLSR